MAYSHDAFPFHMDHQPQHHVYFHHPTQFPPYMQQPRPHPELMFPPHAYADYVDFLPYEMLPEDYDENSEVSTRPRLTKEQVEVLETQFQAHPKPNSMVKKQLALQTKLTLPRVANWFQNRRAKAKQQRKQEEFEISQGISVNSEWKDEAPQAITEPSSKTSSPARSQSVRENTSESLGSRSPPKPVNSKEASWASLQRALNAAESMQAQKRPQGMASATLSMPPPELPRPSQTSKSQKSTQRAQTLSLSPSSDWSKSQSLNGIASPSSVSVSAPMQDFGFDFGFDQDLSATSQTNTTEESPEDMNQQYVVTDDWTTYSAQAPPLSRQADYIQTSGTSPLPLPRYPESRRGSGSDEITADLGTFGLAGTPPISLVSLNSMSSSVRSTEGEIDIASRRKRPRPAALTSSSLRSRSYGQLSSTSPALKAGPPSANVLRHVKSTGHNLNSHYAGIRKSSLPQRSPLNLASFAEADSLKRLMAQQNAAASQAPLTTPLRSEITSISATPEFTSQLGLVEEKANTMTMPFDILAGYQQLQSPPHTPFQPDYMMQVANMSMPPPSSARSQYASFIESTPPYSAGPLTNSTCWSDAPLHSPDVNGFPSGHFLGSLNFTQQQEPSIQQWIIPSEGVADSGLQHVGLPDDHKRTEFLITEFPGQKEEYASIAQQILKPRPKNYVFANTAPSDYDG